MMLVVCAPEKAQSRVALRPDQVQKQSVHLATNLGFKVATATLFLRRSGADFTKGVGER
jgi:hypothetical protein